MEKRLTALKIVNAAGLMSLVLLVVWWQPGVTAATKGQDTETVADANGNLRVPADYRAAYQFLGSWAVAAEQGQGSKEMHVVYASPGMISAYRKDGRFRDGSVLMKEVFETTTGAMTTGTVSRANILKGWFVMMKDSKNSHPDNKLWGDGVVRCRRAFKNHVDKLQSGLSALSSTGAGFWLGLCQGYPVLKQ